jgi:N-acetylneuraminic acid mutarotase
MLWLVLLGVSISAFLLVHSSAGALSRSEQPSGHWQRVAPMPVGMSSNAVLGKDGQIYVMGGTGFNPAFSVLADAEAYDPKTDKWQLIAQVPTRRGGAGVAAGPDGRIYVIGGGTSRNKFLVDPTMNVVEAYDPATKSWTRVKSLPTPRPPAAVTAKGADGRARIYAIGGRNGDPTNGLNTVEAYDPSTDSWTTMAPMPYGRHCHATTTGPDGRIYVIGGTNREVFSTDNMEIYDPVKNTWTFGAPLPYGVECAAATSTSGPDGEVFVIAGWDIHKDEIATVEAYNPRTDKWRRLPDVSVPRAMPGAVTVQTSENCFDIYAIGGFGGNGASDPDPNIDPHLVEKLSICYTDRTNSREKRESGIER